MKDRIKYRIKLCEAMGWVCTSKTTYTDGSVHKAFWRDPETGTGGNAACDLPDPFTSANDDYAVLEWLRSDNDRADAAFEALENMTHCPLPSEFSINYEIGDYARAALKVIE